VLRYCVVLRFAADLGLTAAPAAALQRLVPEHSFVALTAPPSAALVLSACAPAGGDRLVYLRAGGGSFALRVSPGVLETASLPSGAATTAPCDVVDVVAPVGSADPVVDEQAGDIAAEQGAVIRYQRGPRFQRGGRDHEIEIPPSTFPAIVAAPRPHRTGQRFPPRRTHTHP